jgi:hypothetical protein
MDERARRLGENEVLYREVNERVRDLSDEFGLQTEQVDFVCECARLDCAERLPMTLADYQQVRSDGAQFAVKPGHEYPEVEYIVEEHDGYFVIRKREGGPAELARAHS